MALRYGLIPNHLTDDPNDYKGVVTENETITMDQIIDQMIGRGSTVTKAEALSVLEEFSHVVVDAVTKGNNISIDLFKIYPSITGVFVDQQDDFDPSRHTIRLNMNAGPRLKDALANIQVRKVEVVDHKPVIHQFNDLKSKRVNESVTPGQMASLTGTMLRFDEADPNQGIFFVSSNGEVTKATHVIKNKPSELLFFSPDDLKGICQVEVRTLFKDSKRLRVGSLVNELSVTG
jgi:hypothetical protein